VVTTLDTVGLQRLLDASGGSRVQVVEVLPASEFEDEHLPGAVNLPLVDMTTSDAVTAVLDPSRPTVVYCYDYQCDLSPRAAHRLEVLGFDDVYDYVPGKAAWLGEGLASEGLRRDEQRVSAIARADVPTIGVDAVVGDVADALDGDGDVAVVLDDDRIVVGIVRPEVLGLDPKTPVAEVLQPGPSTFRPSMTIKELVGYFRKSDEERAIVSTLTGRWIGLIQRSDVLGSK
jgi:rhodanese-related sulfurtransferase